MGSQKLALDHRNNTRKLAFKNETKIGRQRLHRLEIFKIMGRRVSPLRDASRLIDLKSFLFVKSNLVEIQMSLGSAVLSDINYGKSLFSLYLFKG